MSDCKNHKKEVAGISDMKELAEMIGDLHYESLYDLLGYLQDKFIIDAAKDRAGGRKKLANALEYTAEAIGEATFGMDEAWKQSKPFMESKK